MMPTSSALNGLCPVCLIETAIDDPDLADPGDRGSSIGTIRVLTRLGAGPSSAAYLAEDAGGSGRLLVLKRIVVDPRVLDLDARVERVRRESLALWHSSIATVHDVGLDDLGQPFVLSEYWPGIPLSRYLAIVGEGRGATPPEPPSPRPSHVVTSLCADLRRAVEFAHGQGIVHGNPAGTNLLVARCLRGPVLKVLDFGHAYLAGRILSPPALDEERQRIEALCTALAADIAP
jgi:serine/threonine protein kinase